MYTRVLVPLDGSSISVQVLPYAELVANAAGASMELLRALPRYPVDMVREASQDFVEGVPPPRSLAEWQSVHAEMNEQARQQLEQVAEPLRARGLTVHTTVTENDPADAITAAASADPGTLIAVSTHGRSGIGRWMLGSVTDKVVRYAQHPTLVVRATGDEPEQGVPKLDRIIVPLDGSALAEAAVPHAVELAKTLDLGISLVRSMAPSTYADHFADSMSDMYDHLMDELEADARDYLRDEAAVVRGMGVEDVTESASTGPAAQAVLSEIGEAGKALVVMATHGRSGLGRLLLGSVTDRVVRHSHGPVLIIRSRARE